MSKDLKVFSFETEHGDVTHVCAVDETNAIAAYCYDLGYDVGDLANAKITEFPENEWKDVMIYSNEPTEMPDMPISQWMKEIASENQVICTTEWID